MQKLVDQLVRDLRIIIATGGTRPLVIKIFRYGIRAIARTYPEITNPLLLEPLMKRINAECAAHHIKPLRLGEIHP